MAIWTREKFQKNQQICPTRKVREDISPGLRKKHKKEESVSKPSQKRKRSGTKPSAKERNFHHIIETKKTT